MKAEIINIGTELLLGGVVNTNAAYLSQKLAEIGVDLYHQSTIGDNPARLIDALKQGAKRSDVIITTGGLGPTVDDITIATVAKFAGKRLVSNRMVLKGLRDYFKLRSFALPAGIERQACVPEDALCIHNRVGTAPGLIITYNDQTIKRLNVETIIICLPGPPRELEPMFDQSIIPFLKRRHASSWILLCRTIKIVGLPESRVNLIAKDLLKLNPPTTVGIYAVRGEVHLKIMAKAPDRMIASGIIGKIERVITKRLGKYIFGYDDDTLESNVGELLIRGKKTIAIAESCTGGLITHRLTNVNGSSKYLTMSVVTYANISKVKLLGVPNRFITQYGAVSRQVALAMASGIGSLAKTDIGLSVTGIAGPTGGTKKKPVGLVYIAIVAGNTKSVQEHRFRGSREDIKFQASQVALDMLRRALS